jgi:hypothetical protein
LVPVIVTAVPSVPDAGLIPEMVGAVAATIGLDGEDFLHPSAISKNSKAIKGKNFLKNMFHCFCTKQTY